MSRLPRMVYVVNARLPTEKAHGIQIAKMCEAFIEVGVGMELIVPTRGRDTRTLRVAYGLRVEVPMRRLRVPDWYGSRTGFVISSFLFALRYFLHLAWRRYIRRERFAIYTTDVDQFSFFLIPFLRIPYVVEMHDAKKRRWGFRLLFSRVRCVVAVNSIIKTALADVFGISPDKIAVWPNGYDAHFFAKAEEKDTAREKLGIPTDTTIVLYVGKVYPWKGLDTVVAAARVLADVSFYFVGGTADELRAIGALQDQPQNLICIGQKDLKEIPRWLWAADVLLVSGTAKDVYSYRHTSPMKLFEYMAAGRPIVASRTPAIESVVSDEKVFFCAPDDAPDMAEKIRFVLAHPIEAERKISAASAHLFSWEARARGMRDFMLQHLSVPN